MYHEYFIYEENYMVVRRYEIYLLCFSTPDDKLHTSVWPCNILFVLSFTNRFFWHSENKCNKTNMAEHRCQPMNEKSSSCKRVLRLWHMESFCKYKDITKMNKIDTRTQVNTWTLWGAADSSIVNITDRSNHCWTNISFQIGSRKVKFTSCIFPCLAFGVNPFVYGKFDR